MSEKNTQINRIRQYLDTGKPLTRLIAFEQLWIGNITARISELRYSDYPLKTRMITVKNRFGERVRVAEWKKSTHREV